MMRRVFRLLALPCAALMLCGCPVHQWPVQRNASVISLRYEPDFWLWEHLYDPKAGVVEELYPDGGVDADHPGTTVRYSGVADHGQMRYVVRAYEPGRRDVPVREETFLRSATEGYDCDFQMTDLPAGDYELVVWSDLLETENDAPFYDDADFHRIAFRDGDYLACTDMRDAYRGLAPAVRGDETVLVPMRRPMAKFEFVTTDLSEFLDRETERRKLETRARADEYAVVFSYSSFLPSAYSAFDDELVDAATGVQFRSALTVTGEGEASMGFDYVFINDIAKAEVEVRVTVFDTDGVQVAQSQPIMVPLRRNWHTLLRGAFLTFNARGGVTVDPDFDGDYNITY